MDFKDRAYVKSHLEIFGLTHAYHNFWWRRAARRQPLLTDWNRKHNAVFVHVPKNAGLSTYKMFGMDKPHDTHSPVAGYIAADPAFFAGAVKFAIVRNPWDRLVSGFHYLKHKPVSTNARRWVEDELWADQYLSDIYSFDNFLYALRTPKYRRIVLTWRHFMPQNYFLTTGRSGILVDHLVRFEHLEAGLDAVAARIGVPISMVRLNHSGRAPYAEYYRDPDDIALVGKMYARDIELFGYSFGHIKAPAAAVQEAAPSAVLSTL
jgi:hypothetical protein